MTTNEIAFSAAVDIQAAADGKPATASIVAYSGGIMSPPGFGAVVIDLAGLELSATVPLLANHGTDIASVIGQGTPSINAGQLLIAGIVAKVTDSANQVIALSREGVALQASVGVSIIDSERIAAGKTIVANGRTHTAPRGGILFVTKSKLREVSIVGLGADAETTVSIAASKGANMSEEFNVEEIRTEERNRLKNIGKICEGDFGSFDGKVAELKAQAESGEIDITTLQAGILDCLRASRPKAPNASINGNGHATSKQTLSAAFLMAAGQDTVAEKAYGERTMHDADWLRGASMFDICRAGLKAEGQLLTSMGRDEMIRAALSGGSIPTALGDAAHKSILNSYSEGGETWRSWAAIRPAANFMAQHSIRPSYFGNLEELPNGKSFTHMNAAEDDIQWSIDTYGKIFRIGRQNIVDDDAGFFREVGPAMGKAARRKVSDLVYEVVMANAGSHFSAGNNNLETSAALAADKLAAAITAMRTQRDEDNNDLDIVPKVLLVPPELEHTARGLLESIELLRVTTDQLPTGNNAMRHWNLTLEVEPRLSNTSKFTNASTTSWYLAAGPMDVAAIVGFLGGRTTPTVEFFGMNSHVDELAVAYRVYIDFGAALGDERAAVKNTA